LALLGGVLVGCAVIPTVFSTGVDAVFAVPKLAGLWAVLAFSLAVVAIGTMSTGTVPRLLPAWSVVDVAVGSFVLLNVAAWAASNDRRQSLYGERLQYQGLLTTLLYVGFFYVARLASTDIRRLRLLALAVTTGATLVAAYALVQRAGLDPIWHGYLPGGRVFSTIGQPNALAAYLVLGIPLAASLLFEGNRIRAVILLAVVAMIAALLLTFSRAGYLAFLVTAAVLVVGAWGDPRLTRRRVAGGLAATLVTAVAVFLLVQPARERVADAWHRVASSANSNGDVSVRFHLDAWRVAAQIAVDHPLLGAGQETFPELFPRYSHALLPADRASALDAYRVESPHNVYLAVAAGAGIPALVAYIAIIAGVAVALVRGAWSAATRQIRIALVAVLAALAGHMVTDAFMTAEVTSTWLFWVLLAAGLEAGRAQLLAAGS
jgi:O-antigen ligase